jgi:hypothetical protein
LAQNRSGSGLLKLLKYSMTDAGVSGEGTQSANALPPNNPAINNAISQRLVMCSELPDQGSSRQEMCEFTKPRQRSGR